MDFACAASLTREDVLECVRGMIPALRARVDETEKLRKLHPDAISELRASGLTRALQPARYGGGEYDYPLFLKVLYERARGYASTAWCGFNYGSHNGMLGMFPLEAQDAVSGKIRRR